MKTRFWLESPDDAEATMVITMSLKEWKALDKELDNAWPASRLSQQIYSLVMQAEAKFYGEKVV